MIEEPKKILKKYWGYEQFRPLQEDIINSILGGKDTLALLTTGGGKSICFQVPALCTEGICIVVSPLIALMKDQVENLKRKGIKALAIFSGMSKREIDIALDNCIYGGYKFLYVSPERLKTELFLARLSKMKVNLVAIDEAHCISQWGYDFRPPYLEIAELRNRISAPFLALTATATPRVVLDIQQKLGFKQPNVFQAPFARPNLRYFVSNHEDKNATLMNIVQKQQGTGIIYVRSRKLTVEFAHHLTKRNISADYYHAGLSVEERSAKQLKWINGQTRIIVSTNAFGMGIDKPDVRFVINVDLPECVEAYYQEAGRGGRDEKKAFAILLIDEHDQEKLLKRVEEKFPPKEIIRQVYGLLCNHLRIALGSGELETYPMQLDQFGFQSSLTKNQVYNSLGFLERAGYIELSEGVMHPSKMKIETDNQQLYALQVRYPIYDSVLKVILRSYTGLFDVFVTINEKDIAKRAQLSIEAVKKALAELDEMKVIAYSLANSKETVTFLQPRIDAKYLRLDTTIYDNLKEINFNNARAMIKYAYDVDTCRSVALLTYFGDVNPKPCGVCDVCLTKKSEEVVEKAHFLEIEQKIMALVGHQNMDFNEVVDKISSEYSKKTVKFVARWMIENEELLLTPSNKLQRNE
jgi:ATP-dependent DNA helicase RecQ